jgi:hypothetical protein
VTGDKRQQPARLTGHSSLVTLFRCAARDDDAGGAKQPILEAITAPRLADDIVFRNFLARFVRNGFMQIGIEFLSNGFDRLLAIIGQEIIELFQDKAHARVNWRLFALAARGRETELKIINNRDEPFEQ